MWRQFCPRKWRPKGYSMLSPVGWNVLSRCIHIYSFFSISVGFTTSRIPNFMYLSKASGSVNPWSRWRCNPNIHRSLFESISWLVPFSAFFQNFLVVFSMTIYTLMNQFHSAASIRFITNLTFCKVANITRLAIPFCQLYSPISDGYNWTRPQHPTSLTSTHRRLTFLCSKGLFL